MRYYRFCKDVESCLDKKFLDRLSSFEKYWSSLLCLLLREQIDRTVVCTTSYLCWGETSSREPSEGSQGSQQIILDTSNFERLNEDPTLKRQVSPQRFLRQLKQEAFLTTLTMTNCILLVLLHLWCS